MHISTHYTNQYFNIQTKFIIFFLPYILLPMQVLYAQNTGAAWRDFINGNLEDAQQTLTLVFQKKQKNTLINPRALYHKAVIYQALADYDKNSDGLSPMSIAYQTYRDLIHQWKLNIWANIDTNGNFEDKNIERQFKALPREIKNIEKKISKLKIIDDQICLKLQQNIQISIDVFREKIPLQELKNSQQKIKCIQEHLELIKYFQEGIDTSLNCKSKINKLQLQKLQKKISKLNIEDHWAYLELINQVLNNISVNNKPQTFQKKISSKLKHQISALRISLYESALNYGKRQLKDSSNLKQALNIFMIAQDLSPNDTSACRYAVDLAYQQKDTMSLEKSLVQVLDYRKPVNKNIKYYILYTDFLKNIDSLDVAQKYAEEGLQNTHKIAAKYQYVELQKLAFELFLMCGVQDSIALTTGLAIVHNYDEQDYKPSEKDYFNVGILYQRLNNNPKALEYFNLSNQIKINFDALFSIGKIHFMQGKFFYNKYQSLSFQELQKQGDSIKSQTKSNFIDTACYFEIIRDKLLYKNKNIKILLLRTLLEIYKYLEERVKVNEIQKELNGSN